jgi:hypothetical protein
MRQKNNLQAMTSKSNALEFVLHCAPISAANAMIGFWKSKSMNDIFEWKMAA